jgi:soluble lytic murein transglycosylase-like protein
MTETSTSPARKRRPAALLAALAFGLLGLESIPSISTALAFLTRPAAVAAPAPTAPPEPLTASRFPAVAEENLLAELPYGAFIAEAARKNQIDGWLLAALVETESGFRHRAVSGRGAVGLTQILPATAQAFGSTETDLTDPRGNLDAGASYLAHLLKEFDGDLGLALAAYNAGPNAVKRFGGIPPFAETRDFVSRVLGSYLDNRRQAWEASAAAVLLAEG